MRTSKLIAWLGLLVWASAAQAQLAGVRTAAPAEPDAIPLYGDRTPGSASTEIWTLNSGTWLGVRNVTRPTLTPFLPHPDKATGAAVVVAPGGAFVGLALGHEGWNVARRLADQGIAAFVLKYRLIETPLDDAEALRFMNETVMREVAAPMESEMLREVQGPDDARAALAMVRNNAAKWGIDPKRVGIIGFSAGAVTARRASLDGDPAGWPAFLGYIYGPQDAEPVPADAPPLFNAIAFDDSLFPTKGFPIAAAWLTAKRPVEVHAYQNGNHAFGLGHPGATNALMLDQFVAWLTMQGFLAPKKEH